MRDQEVAFLGWADMDTRRSTLRVSEKTALGFRPKNYQERTVPVPRVLIGILEEHRKLHKPIQELIFATSDHNRGKGQQGGQADRKMLDKLKRIARRAGLNCGKCHATVKHKPVTCATAAVCQEFGLHRFRHTYATTLLRDGVDLLSLQKLLGHKDLDSTRKYLRALEPEELLTKISATSLATRFV
jgi:integrase/recombinase XerD